jgi:arsenite methyltransferase
MKQRANYGIDAPGVVRGLLGFGTLAALAAIGSVLFAKPDTPIFAVWPNEAIAAGCMLVAGGSMVFSSLVSKMRVRDRLVNALALTGNERVLDAGCGRGLALIGCAKKLTTGKAVGIDLWSAKDLSNNNPDATRANAAAEGVADKVDVETGNITKLPFPDASFDAIISMTVIHNIPARDDRDQALRELARVLKPGGRMAIFDIQHPFRYMTVLKQAGLEVESLGFSFLWFQPCRSILAKKV